MKDIGKLAALEELRSLKSRRDLAEISAKESTLRAELEELSARRTHANSTDPSLMMMRSMGADVLWSAWLHRTQRELNMELAKTLAMKEPLAAKAKRDIGRSEAIAQLESGLNKQARQEWKRAQRIATSELAILSKLNGKSTADQ